MAAPQSVVVREIRAAHTAETTTVYRSLQVGLSGEAVRRYVDEWLVTLTDVTPLAREIHGLVTAGDEEAARVLLPAEHPYPLSADIAATITATA